MEKFEHCLRTASLHTPHDIFFVDSLKTEPRNKILTQIVVLNTVREINMYKIGTLGYRLKTKVH